MAQKRRDSDLSSELYFSIYGNNRKLEPEKIKSYALYKPLLENTAANNFVVAANETNEIFVSFKEGSESKVFTFDKVFYSDIPRDDFYVLYKSIIQDVIMGVNSFLILCKLASEIQSSFKMDLPRNIIANVLKELLLFINQDENKDCSLHVSYFEMHGNKLFDLLNKFKENINIQLFENLEKGCIEIKGLIEKSIIIDKDIDEILSKKLFNSECNAICCHFIVFISLVRRNINNEGLEFIKVGKLTLVGPAECKNSESKGPNTDDCLMNVAEKEEFPAGSKDKTLNILMPAFEGNVKTTVIVFLSSVLYALEKDLQMLQFSSKVRNLFAHPEIDLQLIIRNSTKEYAEEIKELQKVLDTSSRGNGVKIDHLLYRSYNNSLAFENEKVKNLSGTVLGLTDSINSKKQELIKLRATLQLKETEIREIETSYKTLELELEEVENENNNVQKVSLKADEIIDVKQMIVSNEQYVKKLKLQLRENNRNYEDLIRSIHFLKNETSSFLCDLNAQNTTQKSALQLLIVHMNDTFSEFQHLEKDLMLKLNNLLDIDTLIRSWKLFIENLMSKFSSFVHNHHENFKSMELETWNPDILNYASSDVAVNIKDSLTEERLPVLLENYFIKIQVFCDESFKLLAEIIHQMDVIENCYKIEFKAISAAFGSIKEVFKKSISGINMALKSFQQYFVEQEKELTRLIDTIYFHHKFKKKFDEKIADIKKSFLDLKQTYLNYYDTTSKECIEIQKGCQKTIQKHYDLSNYLSLFQKEMFKYLNNLPQQKINILEYSPLKSETDNVENQMLQLLQMHKEMKGNLDEAFVVHKKGIDEEFLEVKKYMSLRKAEIEKDYDVISEKLKANASSFLDDLRSIHKDPSKNEDKFKRDLDSLSSSIFHFEPIYNNYCSTSSNILTKSERCFKVIPSVISGDNEDNISNFENLFLEEWKVTTSTPNIPEMKEFNISKEKEILMSRVKCVAEQQMPQKSNVSLLDYEEKETKNISTVSLPLLRTHSKASLMSEKSFPRLKSRKK